MWYCIFEENGTQLQHTEVWLSVLYVMIDAGSLQEHDCKHQQSEDCLHKGDIKVSVYVSGIHIPL